MAPVSVSGLMLTGQEIEEVWKVPDSRFSRSAKTKALSKIDGIIAGTVSKAANSQAMSIKPSRINKKDVSAAPVSIAVHDMITTGTSAKTEVTPKTNDDSTTIASSKSRAITTKSRETGISVKKSQGKDLSAVKTRASKTPIGKQASKRQYSSLSEENSSDPNSAQISQTTGPESSSKKTKPSGEDVDSSRNHVEDIMASSSDDPTAVSVKSLKPTTAQNVLGMSKAQAESMHNSRPPCYGSPLIWADGRQALCETLPYYRAYQSGPYTHDGLAYGFLLDKDFGERPYLDEEVAITRAGGGMRLNSSGVMVQKNNHSTDMASLKSFRRNQQMNVPVVLIAGKGNAGPSEIPHRYCVLAQFQVTDIWAEKTRGKTVYKYRFEKIRLASKSWWAAQGSPQPAADRDFVTKAFRCTCDACQKESPQVFLQVWMCLNPECCFFWKIAGDETPSGLNYNPAFLEERTEWPFEIKLADLKPPLLNADAAIGIGISQVALKGIVCTKCGRCNSRDDWDAWRCKTPDCNFMYRVRQDRLSARQVLRAHDTEFSGHALPLDTIADSICCKREYLGEWLVQTYTLIPGNHIAHFSANAKINSRAGSGPDAMFLDLQDANIPLKRGLMKSSLLQGRAVANHFSLNYGLPYVYVVDTESKAFNEAPDVLLRALQRLTWAGQHTVRDGTFIKFNELLAVGYFESQKMGYHDDGEKSLGPTIGTLSLGGKATMTMRMKLRYYTGFTKSGNYKPTDPILPGSLMEQERRELNELYESIPQAEFDEKVATLYESVRTHKNPPVLVSMLLNHGDMVTMHGDKMQKYYEHLVVPSNTLRFALTCRYVKPECVSEDQHWKGSYEFNPAHKYDGDGAPVYDDEQMLHRMPSDASPTVSYPVSTLTNTTLDVNKSFVQESALVSATVEHFSKSHPARFETGETTLEVSDPNLPGITTRIGLDPAGTEADAEADALPLAAAGQEASTSGPDVAGSTEIIAEVSSISMVDNAALAHTESDVSMANAVASSIPGSVVGINLPDSSAQDNELDVWMTDA